MGSWDEALSLDGLASSEKGGRGERVEKVERIATHCCYTDGRIILDSPGRILFRWSWAGRLLALSSLCLCSHLTFRFFFFFLALLSCWSLGRGWTGTLSVVCVLVTWWLRDHGAAAGKWAQISRNATGIPGEVRSR